MPHDHLKDDFLVVLWRMFLKELELERERFFFFYYASHYSVHEYTPSRLPNGGIFSKMFSQEINLVLTNHTRDRTGTIPPLNS